MSINLVIPENIELPCGMPIMYCRGQKEGCTKSGWRCFMTSINNHRITFNSCSNVACMAKVGELTNHFNEYYKSLSKEDQEYISNII